MKTLSHKLYTWFLNINYNKTFNSLQFKTKNNILLFRGLWYNFFILMWIKIFIYFVNLTTCKSKNIFVILFYYLYFFISKS